MFFFFINVNYFIKILIVIIFILGAFRVEMQRENQKDRTILCKFDPTEPGDYRVEVKWAGEHVPGSPFMVMIFDTQEELNRFLQVCILFLIIYFLFFLFFIHYFRVIIRRQVLICTVVLIIHQVMLILLLNLWY